MMTPTKIESTRKFGYIAFEEIEVYDIRNSITEAREDALATIEQLGGKAIIIKFEVIEIVDGQPQNPPQKNPQEATSQSRLRSRR